MSKQHHSFRTNRKSSKEWFEVPPDPAMLVMINENNSYLRCYLLGSCTVVVTQELGRWHMSIAHPERYPTWDEIATARYRAIPNEIWMVMVLPPPEQYINIHENCMQLLEIDEKSLID